MSVSSTQRPRVLGFSPDGHRIAVGDANTVLVWRTNAPGFPQRYEAHGGRVLSAAWSADGTTLVTGAEDGTVIQWDTTGRHDVGAVLNDDLGDDTGTLWATPEAIVVGQEQVARMGVAMKQRSRRIRKDRMAD